MTAGSGSAAEGGATRQAGDATAKGTARQPKEQCNASNPHCIRVRVGGARAASGWIAACRCGREQRQRSSSAVRCSDQPALQRVSLPIRWLHAPAKGMSGVEWRA